MVSVQLGLAGKVVLITGGSDGLGAALVRALSAEGAKVAFCARTEDRIEELASELRAVGGDAIGVRADVREAADLERFVAEAVGRWGRIDALVNNAGASAAARLDEQTESIWDDDLDLKVRSAIRLIRLALPHLRAAGGASIVNVLAIAAKAPPAGSTPSSVSRAAGLALTKALSRELGPDQIRVNAVLIGSVRSGQGRRAAHRQNITVDDYYDKIAATSGIPLGRAGLAAEFADLALFLLSERSTFITGAGINFDGGQSPVT